MTKYDVCITHTHTHARTHTIILLEPSLYSHIRYQLNTESARLISQIVRGSIPDASEWLAGVEQ